MQLARQWFVVLHWRASQMRRPNGPTTPETRQGNFVAQSSTMLVLNSCFLPLGEAQSKAWGA
eukprot:6479524-Amphidinium_carterae.2